MLRLERNFHHHRLVRVLVLVLVQVGVVVRNCTLIVATSWWQPIRFCPGTAR
jgi:hypothetical protein